MVSGLGENDDQGEVGLRTNEASQNEAPRSSEGGPTEVSSGDDRKM